ncbi:UNVERIFIED_CONTAM: hypothetical protein K2H54_045852 [Gekko kuhli]
MATAAPMSELRKESSCPVCLNYFRDPVILCCGHNFCQVCIAQYWRESEGHGAASCPECRKPLQQREAWPNWQLASVVRLVKEHWGDQRAAGALFMCQQHQRPLKFFCEDDQDSLCAVCKRTKRHKGHSIVLVEVIAREYKEKVKAQLQSLEEKAENN